MVLQRGCIQCGDCLSGCNSGQKHSGDEPLGYRQAGWRGDERADVGTYTGVEVQFVSKLDCHYQVHNLLHHEQPEGEIVNCPGRTTAGLLVLVYPVGGCGMSDSQ
jgi:hypothetical protein